MKVKILIMLIIMLIMVLIMSCVENKHVKPVAKKYSIQVIDSCEYVIYNYAEEYTGYGYMIRRENVLRLLAEESTGYGYITHKGNCKYCIQRDQ